jgi:hypothetical protein
MWSLGFFYCRFSDPASQKPHHILGSLISQFARYDPSILSHVRQLYDLDKPSSHHQPAELSRLEEILCIHLRHSSRAYILIDAPNECQDMSFIHGLLVDTMKECPNLRVLVASTGSPPDEVQQTSKSREVRLHALMNKNDLTTLIDHSFVTKPGLQNLSGPLKQDVRTTLVSQANGS